MDVDEVERVDWIFNSDVIEKKKLARQAKYRKRGSKKCTLSTDSMTHKQWLERCGNTVVYNYEKPILWDDFCELPIHIQKEYLLRLIQKYHTTASDLAKMFGIAAPVLSKYCGNEEIGIKFSRGKRMTKQERMAFREFCGDKDDDADDETVEEASDATERICVNEKNEVAKEQKDMAMTEFSLSFSGGFSREMIYNSLASMLPNGTEVKMEIKCLVAQ